MEALPLFVCFIAVCFGVKHTQSEPFQAPSYNIDLDLPAEQRWVDITKKYAKYTLKIVADIRKKISESEMPLAAAEKRAMDIYQHLPEPFPEEIRGVSKGLNMTIVNTTLLNIIYDLTASCTSIVAQDKDGNIFHGRNLDYDFSELLRNMTFISNFQRKGKTLCTGVMFAGQVGFLTAQRPNAFTVSLDQRDQCCKWKNIFEAVFNKNASPITFLIRKVVCTEGMDFDNAVKMISQAPLIAGAYLIVGGMSVGQGVVITRNRENATDMWYLSKDAAKSPWYLVETNYDHWKPNSSDDRRHTAEKALTKLTQQNLTAKALFKYVMSVNPVLNNRTIYTTIMQAKTPDLFNTWIQRP